MNLELNKAEVPVSELLQGCIEGKRKSWDFFFEKFHRIITGVILQKTFNNTDDTIQLVYLRLVENDYNLLKKFKGNSYGALLLYLKEVAKNVVREEFKKNFNKNQITDSLNGIEHILVDPHSLKDKESDDDINLLLEKIMELDFDFRIVLTFRYLGYKTKEISEILDIPLNTVLTRIKRGIEKLKKNNITGIK
ncbi:MAG: sigma-70 family RNA polymerase sigma factor [Spirochaetia bacterium]|nr:sigma-70 family RNA polymerase sigma factor [Spirochaetia bacterium]